MSVLNNGFTAALVNSSNTSAYFEARWQTKLAASLIMYRRPMPIEYADIFPNDQYCWQERVDVSSRFKRRGLATLLLHFADEQLNQLGHSQELRYFVDLNGNGFMTYLAAQDLLHENGKEYFLD